MAAPHRPAAGPRWGWHQLDPRWAERLVELAAPPRRAYVLDIGAGLGALTVPLLAHGCHVIAVEAHPARAAALRERLGASHDGRLVVVRTDARELRLPRQPYHVVANPPFAISADLLRLLLQPGSRMLSAHLVLQRQVAERWAGRRAPAWSRWGRTFAADLPLRLPRSAFAPAPPVDAAVLRLVRRPGA